MPSPRTTPHNALTPRLCADSGRWPGWSPRARLALAWVALAALLLGATVGCNDDPCDAVTCASGQTCAAGVCVDSAVENCNRDGCPDDATCDAASGRCIARGVDCRPASEACDADAADCATCPDGLYCDVSAGYCVPGDPCGLIQCARSQTCNPDTGQCANIACDATVGCPSGSICTDSGVCALGCVNDDDCPRDERCSGAVGGNPGRCVPVCTEDVECAWGQSCQTTDSGQRCLPEPPCAQDSDCRDDEVCLAQTCRRPLCASDDDCDAAERCALNTGDCLPNTCVADVFEPNDTPSDAARLLVGNYQGLSLCYDDPEDWFAVRTHPDQDTVIQLLYAPTQADLDLEVYADDGALLGVSGQAGLVDRVRLAPSGREVFARVRAVRGSDAAYLLQIETQASACDDDPLEPNDVLAQASTVAAPQREPLALTSCPDDVDLFTLLPPAGGASFALTLEADPGADAAALDGWTTEWSRDGVTWLPLDAPSAGLRTLELAFLSADQRPLLRVRAFEPIAWSLVLDTSPRACVNPDTAGASPSQAALVELTEATERSIDQGALCPESPGALEADWYRLQLPDTDVILDVTAQAPPQATTDVVPTLRAALYTGDPPTPWRASTATPSAPDTPAQTRLFAELSRIDRPVWVVLDATPERPTVVPEWPTYSLRFKADPKPDQSCVQDRSEGEGNATRATATPLPQGTLRAQLCNGDTDVLLLTRPTTNTAPHIALAALEASVQYQLTDDDTIDLSGLADDAALTSILAWDDIPPEVEFLWLIVAPDDPDRVSGTPYTVRNGAL